MRAKKTIFRVLLFVMALFLLFPVSFGAGAYGADEYPGLTALIEEALKNNPQIHAARKKYEAARARVRLLRTVADPQLQYEYDTISAGAGAIERGQAMPMHMYSVSQEIPFPTKLFLRRQAAASQAQALKEEYKEKENEIIQKVKEGFFSLSLLGKEIAITRDTKGLFDELIKTLASRYALGRASQKDVLTANLEYAKLDSRLIFLEEKKKIAQAMLGALLNRHTQIEFPEPERLGQIERISVEKGKLFARMREKRPELKASKAMVEKAKIDYRLAKQEYFPDLMVRYTREEENGSAGAWAGMVGITFPFWFWDKQDSFVQEARAHVQEIEAEYQNLENMISYEVEAAAARVEAQERLIKLYETSFLPQAEAVFKTAAGSFDAGRGDFLDLIDSQRMVFEFKLEYARALIELEVSLADLERVMGAPLEAE